MKLIVDMACLVAMLVAASCTQPHAAPRGAPGATASADSFAREDDPELAATVRGDASRRVVVYYFHRTLRCVDCLELESLTVKALERFAEEQKQGSLVLTVLNVEEPENEHFIADFGIRFNTIIIARERGGVRTQWKDLGERAWDLMPYPDDFTAFLTAEVEDFLQED